jgi:multiple sugar transport system ATP-binding protein
VVRGPGGVALPLPGTINLAAGRKVAYGIRPEHLRPSTNGVGLPAKVAVVEPTGPDIHIYADLGGQEVVSVTSERLELSPDSEIRLVPNLQRVHLFDQDSGKAIHG